MITLEAARSALPWTLLVLTLFLVGFFLALLEKQDHRREVHRVVRAALTSPNGAAASP